MIKKLRIKFIFVHTLLTFCILLIALCTLSYYVNRSNARKQTNELHRLAGVPGKKPPFDGRLDGEIEEEKYITPNFSLEYGQDGTLKAVGSEAFKLSDENELMTLYLRVMAESEADGVLKDYGLRYYRFKTPSGQKIVFADMNGSRVIIRYLIYGFALLELMSLAVTIPLSRWVVRPVEEAWKEQKQFVTDASHELKTPLTVIMSNAELLQQPGYDEAQRRIFSENILTMSRQMRTLLDGLLQLARLDNVQNTADSRVLNYSALVEECLLPFEPLFFERGLQFEAQIEKDVYVFGHDGTLRQCVEILLDNAQKYSAPGKVTLRLSSSGRYASLTVENPTTEMDETECRKVFKRFYRRDEARSPSGSYGLGLPIAQGIILRHHGKINCSWDNGNIRFTVLLPLAE